MRMKNADLKEKLELAVEKFQEETREAVAEIFDQATDNVEHEIHYRTEYFLKELLIDLGLKKRPKMTITEKQVKEVLDSFYGPALLEQIMGPSPLMAQLLKDKEKEKKCTKKQK